MEDNRHFQNASSVKGCNDTPLGLFTFSDNLLIRDPAHLETKISSIKADGPSKIQVIADFDMTLTKFMINGKRGLSCHSLVNTPNEEINKKRIQLFEEYYPHEINPLLTFELKYTLMEEWWNKSHNLICQGGLSLSQIKESVSSANIEFRQKLASVFDILDKHNIPVLIFSAGLADVIEEVLRQKLHQAFPNIRVVSNRMEFDENGVLVGFKGKVIHVLNKNEHALSLAAPMHNEEGKFVVEEKEGYCEEGILHRYNVILLGDHLGDLSMSDGLNFHNRITIGFLNDNVEKWKETYMEKFDIVVLNDGTMDVVLELLGKILAP